MKFFASTSIAIALLFSAGAFVQGESAQASEANAKKSVKAPAQKRGHKPKQKSSKKTAGGSNLSRDVVFDGSVINGKYLAAGEAVSTVEADKSLSNLIGLRTDFKDRLADERQRLKGGSQGEK